MEVLYHVCCGLDVHKKTVAACLRLPGPKATRTEEIRTFGTTTRELLRLADWLAAAGCTRVAMESTGVYWRPVYQILEGNFELLLVNAQHIKAVPGRKTDVKECQWIARLLEHGLLRASFVPPAPFRELRELTRYRRQLVQERAREANRVQKVLETANIKLGDVATDVLGASGRAMLKALSAGDRDAETLAGLAQGLLRKKEAQLRRPWWAALPTTTPSCCRGSCATSSSWTSRSRCSMPASRPRRVHLPRRSSGSTLSPALPSAVPSKSSPSLATT
jgi:transposase